MRKNQIPSIGILLLSILLFHPQPSNAQIGAAASIGVTASGGGGGGGADASATYLVQTSTHAPSNAQVMGLLASGLVFNTTTTGVQTTIPLSGNAWQLFNGAGSFTTTFPKGTITSSTPYTFSETWNNGAVTFHDFVINVTETAAANDSCMFEIVVVGGGQGFSACKFGNAVVASAYNFTSSAGEFVTGSELASFKGLDNDKIYFNVDEYTCPNCGTGPTLAGTLSLGRATLGTTPNATTLVITKISQTWISAPHCDGYNETTNSPLIWSSSTTAVTWTGTFAAGNVISWHCASF